MSLPTVKQGGLATDYQKYYVYQHVDPNTGVVVYVGKGSNARAWSVGKDRHSKAHHEWMQSLILEGYIPCDWAQVFSRGLNEEQALALEKSTINLCNPVFNIQFSGKYKHRTIMKKAKKLYTQGLSGRAVSRILGIPSITAWRMIHVYK